MGKSLTENCSYEPAFILGKGSWLGLGMDRKLETPDPLDALQSWLELLSLTG